MPRPYQYFQPGMPDISGAVSQGVALARNLQGIRAARAQEMALQQQALAQQQAEQQQKQFQADLSALGTNPTAQQYQGVLAKYPGMAAQAKKYYDILDEPNKEAELRRDYEVMGSLEAGNIELTNQIIDRNISAFENANDTENLQEWRQLQEVVKGDPNSAKRLLGLKLASLDEKFPEKYGKLGAEKRAEELAPAAVTKAEAEAEKAVVEAEYLPAEIQTNLRQKGYEVEKLLADIDTKREDRRIKMMDAQLKRETNELKKREIEGKLATAERDKQRTIRKEAADFSAATSDVDNMVNTIDRMLAFDEDTFDDMLGPLESRFPTLSEDVANLEALVETVDSQVFMARIPAMTGKGALSDAEGRKLAASLQNLTNLKQGREQYMTNLREAQRLILKARDTLADKYGRPRGTPESPFVRPSGQEITDLVNKYTE